MAMPFEVFTDHYALQWIKTMRTGPALLHRWSAALEEYDFTVRHRPGKVQTHVDTLSRLPVGPAPPEDALLHIQMDSEEEACWLAKELHTVTHLGGQTLWKLSSDRYSHKAGRRICIEVAQSCPQCQMGSDYGHRVKTTGSIQSKGPWDTLSVDIVGALPADRRHEFLIVFVDCFSRYSILVLASNHTASTVSDALLRHVVPYFDTPRRLLSDRGREFVGEAWSKLTHSLGIQRLLTSPYHPEGNAINKRSHRTINNMLRAHLLEGVPSRTWIDKINGIMLMLNAMVHEPHGFSASMIATGRELTLPPDLEGDACASPALEEPASYVEAVKKRLTLTHQQMTPPPAPVATNPYREGSLIFVMTTSPERSNKLTPRWKGPFLVKRVPNPYQVTYEDGLVWRTVHVNHVKPAKTPADGFPAPLPPPEPPQPTLGCLPRSLQRPLSRRPLPPPQPAAPTAGPPHPVAAPPAATPPSSRPTTRSAANRNSAPRAVQQPPTTLGRTNDNSRLGQPARLTPRACAIKSHPQPAAPQLRTDHKMARTYPLSLAYGQCLGHEEGDPYAFSSLYLEDLRSGRKEYIINIQQLVDAIPKSLDPTSRFALRAQVTQDISACDIPCASHCGGSCHPMGTSAAQPTVSSIIWHARDGVWSCEGVILRYPITRAVYTGSMTQRHPRLAAWNIQIQCLPVIPVPLFPANPVSPFPVVTVFPFPVILCTPLINQCLCVINVKTRRPPLLRAAQQELLSPHLFLRNTGGGEGDRLREQPIEIWLLVQPPR